MKQADRIGARHTRDPRGRRHARSCATWRAASSARSTSATLVGRGDWRRELDARLPAAAAPNAYRDTWCGQVLADRVDSRGPGRRLGPPPPRPRRADLHRPARPHRPRPARLQPRRGGRRLRARPTSCAPRTCSAPAATVVAPLRGDGQPASCRPASSRSASPRPSCSPTPRRRRSRSRASRGEVGEEPRLRYRYLDLRRERMRDALALRHRVTDRDARVPRRRGLPRDRDAGPDPLDAGGRPRLPRPQPPPAGLLLRAAAVAAALQAAADGRRLRALLPDRPLLPRRGPARRPPARVHPARHRDVVRRGRGRDRAQRAAARPRPRRAWGSRSSCRSRACPTTRRWPASAPTGPTSASGSSSSTSPTSCARPSSTPSAR